MSLAPCLLAGGARVILIQFLMFIFMKDYMNGTKSNAQIEWAQTKQTGCYVETKYYCHVIVIIGMIEAIFAYVAQAEYNCHRNKKVANCFDRVRMLLMFSMQKIKTILAHNL